MTTAADQAIRSASYAFSMSTATALPADSPSKTDSLATSVLILLVLTVIQRVVGLLRSVLFCRWLDADQLGQWDLAFGFLMLAAPLALLGIPGSFGRYIEHYRQRGQLRTFLRRSTWICALASGVCVIAVAIWPSWFSSLIFGRPDLISLVIVVAATLASVIAFNYLVTLFTALRKVRMVSAMQFLNTVLFAAIALTLLMTFPPSGLSVIVAFGAASLITAVFATWRLLPIWRETPLDAGVLSHSTLWRKLLPFAFWWWMMNWISNVFEIVDRFMIVHYSGLNDLAALDMVGQYHSARVLPVLFIGVADMLASLVTPHLTADWEAGRRNVVSQRLNTIVKVFALGMVVASALLLVIAPTLFGTVFKHKFTGGLDILPMALAACIWTGVASVMNNYLWCAEKSHHLSLSLGAGLVLNIVLNLVLLPAFGLQGVAIASAASKAVSLVLLLWIAAKYDWQSDRGLVLVALLPLLLPLGPWLTLLVAILAVAGYLPTLPFLRHDEQAFLIEMTRSTWMRIKSRLVFTRTAASGHTGVL
jgi:polysaccharide transporter, PST family